MAAQKRKNVREEDVTGLKYFDKLAPLLARLHDVGCERDKAGNRTLHFDQHCMLTLLFVFNPVVRSLRAIEQASQLRKVQRKLGCQRASLGSLSESTDVFEPELLKEIIAELGGQLQPIARDPRLKDVEHTLTLVDGTLLKGLPVLIQAGMQDPRAAKLEAKVRLHTQFDLERGVPIRIDVTEGTGRGENSERRRGQKWVNSQKGGGSVQTSYDVWVTRTTQDDVFGNFVSYEGKLVTLEVSSDEMRNHNFTSNLPTFQYSTFSDVDKKFLDDYRKLENQVKVVFGKEWAAQ